MYKYKQIIFLIADVFAVTISFLLSVLIVYKERQISLVFEYTWLLLLIAGFTVIVFYLMDLYFFRRDFTNSVDLINLFLSLIIVFIVESALIYVSGAKKFIWREFLLVDTIIKSGLIIFFKIILSIFFMKIKMVRRALIIGSNNRAKWGIDFIRKNKDLDIEPTGLILTNEIDAQEYALEGLKIIKHDSNFLKIIENLDINLIILAADAEKISTFQESLILCHQKQIPLITAEKLYENVTNKVPFEQIDSLQLFNSCLWQGKFRVFRSKRLLDIIVSAFFIIITLPIMLIAAFLIKISSPGPILFKQTRLGLNGKPFELMKFRTMHLGAEKETGPVFTMKNDKRVTEIGSFLRKTHLDEIPQFFNVLLGHMSVVGPRPERPNFIEKLEQVIPFYSLRLSVPPGITGWAQVKYRYASSLQGMKEKFRYDLYYIKNLSFVVDVKIIIQTIFHVLLVKGH